MTTKGAGSHRKTNMMPSMTKPLGKVVSICITLALLAWWWRTEVVQKPWELLLVALINNCIDNSGDWCLALWLMPIILWGLTPGALTNTYSTLGSDTWRFDLILTIVPRDWCIALRLTLLIFNLENPGLARMPGALTNLTNVKPTIPWVLRPGALTNLTNVKLGSEGRRW